MRSLYTKYIVTRSRIAGAALAFALVASCAQPADDPPVRQPLDSVPQQPLPALDGVVTVTPIDEASRDPSLVAARDSLLAIARRQDTAALARFLDPNVRYSFGASDGRRGFLAYWMKYESLDKLWRTIEDVLTHGGRFRDSVSFTAPWTFTALPESLDAFTHLVVRDSAVPAYTTPDSSDTPLGVLSYTAVLARNHQSDGEWRGIILPNGVEAYVLSRHVRSPVDYRLGLSKQDGRWRVQFFVAGD